VGLIGAIVALVLNQFEVPGGFDERLPVITALRARFAVDAPTAVIPSIANDEVIQINARR
jgi:hypothetical protein